jgi:hypothetical protein
MKRILATAACLIALAGCSTSPADVVGETADKLGEIRSGDMALEVLAGTATGGARTGFRVEGPFSLPEEEGELPVLDLEYTQIGGEQEVTSRFISDGSAMFIETEEGTFELPEEQTESFRTAGSSENGSILSALDLESWMVDPQMEEAGDTQTVTAELDAVAAINDLFGLARDLGTGAPEPLEGDSAEQVENAVDSASFEMVTGTEDRLLRRLAITIELAADQQEQLESIADLLGVNFEMELTIERPNEPVSVQAPSGAEPLP